MTIHHEEPARPPGPLVWTVVFTILLVAAVAIFALVLISLVASRITTGRAKRLPARFLRRRGRARDFIPLINVQSGGPLWGEPLTFWTLLREITVPATCVTLPRYSDPALAGVALTAVGNLAVDARI